MKASSIKHNIIANFAGRAWTSLMSLVFIPFYIKFVGIEAYGLMGIFVSLMALLSILDLGLSSTLSRELARLSVVEGSTQEARNLVRTLEVIYWVIGILIGLGLIMLAPLIATHWVKTQGLPTTTVQNVIIIMGIIIAFQWPTSLYGGGLVGLQKQVLLNSVNGGLATVQFGGAVLVLWLISPTVIAFFVWQIFISILHTAILAGCLWMSIPRAVVSPMFQKQLLVKNWGFAAGMTGLAVMATILTQMDKIILSKLLTLKIFGFYVLAYNVANAVSYLAAPISTALFPKFSQLVVQQADISISSLYHKGCQLVSLIILPAALTLAFFSKEIMSFWLHDPETVNNTYPLVSLIVIGTAMNSLMALPYTLQIAHGWTKLVFVQNVISIILLIPLLIIIVKICGVVGAPIVWIILNLGYIAFLIPLMHRRLLVSEMKQWYLMDTGLPILIGTISVFLLYLVRPSEAARYMVFFWLFLTPIIAVILIALALPYSRNWISISLLKKPADS